MTNLKDEILIKAHVDERQKNSFLTFIIMPSAVTASRYRGTCSIKDFVAKISVLEDAVNKNRFLITESEEISRRLEVIQTVANPRDLQIACTIYDQVIEDYHLLHPVLPK